MYGTQSPGKLNNPKSGSTSASISRQRTPVTPGRAPPRQDSGDIVIRLVSPDVIRSKKIVQFETESEIGEASPTLHSIDEARLAKIEQDIHDAFFFFDSSGLGFVPSEQLGPILCALGFNPTQSQVAEILEQIAPEGTIPWLKFSERMVKLAVEHESMSTRHREDEIKAAFKALDPDNKGYIEPDRLASVLSSFGEQFTPEEVQETIEAATDPLKGVVFYEQYARILARSGILHFPSSHAELVLFRFRTPACAASENPDQVVDLALTSLFIAFPQYLSCSFLMTNSVLVCKLFLQCTR
eukprot:TRINITY_DN3742_c0_g1_i2.p1 TRINITY_DN3742_c0_g1~~TRINITY_DN3742_c0_g1_i2.p1  ORF type:complete len:316 (-),score=-36.29 TRINITY_DN3742_c0_g1_i2:16-909(-)